MAPRVAASTWQYRLARSSVVMAQSASSSQPTSRPAEKSSLLKPPRLIADNPFHRVPTSGIHDTGGRATIPSVVNSNGRSTPMTPEDVPPIQAAFLIPPDPPLFIRHSPMTIRCGHLGHSLPAIRWHWQRRDCRDDRVGSRSRIEPTKLRAWHTSFGATFITSTKLAGSTPRATMRRRSWKPGEVEVAQRIWGQLDRPDGHVS